MNGCQAYLLLVSAYWYSQCVLQDQSACALLDEARERLIRLDDVDLDSLAHQVFGDRWMYIARLIEGGVK